MNREDLVRKIKKRAREDQLKRRDRRFLETMGLLVAKGFLRTNLDVPLLPNKRVRIEDAVWAGQNVEPRILEVLPAAVLRLGKHFDLDSIAHKELARVVDQLRRREETGDTFLGTHFDKMKVWADLPLRDKRVKPVARKKVSKTYRLEPAALEVLRSLAEQRNCSETEVIETMLLSASDLKKGAGKESE